MPSSPGSSSSSSPLKGVLLPLLLTTTTTLTLFPTLATASYAFYVGSALTTNNATLVGGTGEEVSSHSLQLFPAADHPANSTISVGVTSEAILPGKLIQIPQVPHTYRYLSMEYSSYEGFPAPLTNGGVNEKGVAVRDVWATNRQELYDMTPNPQYGVQYSDLARLVMERAGSAREGVEVIGGLIKEYGYATYGGNTHLIADKDEGWVVWEFAGGKGLWAAEKLGKDEVRVLYPGYIEKFPVDFLQNSEDYMGSDNLVEFAVEKGWWDPSGGDKEFNIFDVYGPQGDRYKARTGGYKYMSQAALEEATLAMVPVSEKDLMERVRDPRISDDESGYGQVVSLKEGVDSDMIRIWNAPTGSVAAPFIPWWLGVNAIPPEFGEHRYLTEGASSTFLDVDYQLQEASTFAGRLFKRVLYYMCSAPQMFHPIVTDMFTGFEDTSRRDLEWVEKSAQLLIDHGERETAKKLLTHYSHTKASEAMELGKRMTDALDGYVKLSGQWKGPEGDRINDPGLGAQTVNCLVGFDPDRPADHQDEPSNMKRRRGKRSVHAEL